jgi:hypothetical protein
MKQLENPNEKVKLLSNLLADISPTALYLNQISPEAAEDSINSNRTGQCAGVVQWKLHRLGVHYIPTGLKDPKIRYTIVANNKINCLLENPEEETTFPFTSEEKKIWGGGIRSPYADDLLYATSGFYPKIDEGCSILKCVTLSDLMVEVSNNTRKIELIQTLSHRFKNRYALPIACGSKLVKNMSFDEAYSWGIENIR